MANFWCKLNLDIMEADWFSNPKMLQLYIFFLLYSSRNRLNDKEVSFNISYKIIESYTGMKKEQVRWALKKMVSEKMVKVVYNTSYNTNNTTTSNTNYYISYNTKKKKTKLTVTLCEPFVSESKINREKTVQQHQPQHQKQQNKQHVAQQGVQHQQDLYLFNNNNKEYIDNKDFVNLEENLQDCGGGGQKTQQDFEIFFEEVKNEWNKKCGSFEKIKYFGVRREKILQKLAEDFKSINKLKDALFECFNKISKNKFLSGEGPKKWRCSFNWLISSPENIAKVLEDYYQDLNYNQTKTRPDNETKCRRIKSQNIGADSKVQSAEDFSETL